MQTLTAYRKSRRSNGPGVSQGAAEDAAERILWGSFPGAALSSPGMSRLRQSGPAVVLAPWPVEPIPEDSSMNTLSITSAPMPDVSGRSEHACNCVLNEAEAAASRGGRHPSMDLSACASVEDGVCDEPGLARKFRGLCWIAHACRLCAGWNQSSHSLGAHGERQRHRRMAEQRSSRGCRRSCPQSS
jgi:hypothetical protein